MDWKSCQILDEVYDDILYSKNLRDVNFADFTDMTCMPWKFSPSNSFNSAYISSFIKSGQ